MPHVVVKNLKCITDDYTVIRVYPSRINRRTNRAILIDRFKAWLAYPLGYCIYCNTTIITIVLCILYLSSYEVLPTWQNIIIGVIAAIGVQHLVVLDVSKYLMNK